MSNKYFLDTNILVYAHDQKSRSRQTIAQDLIFQGLRDESAVISTQVISEYLVTITRKIEVPLTVDKAVTEIELFRAFNIIEIDVDMIIDANKIHTTNQISYWDSLIVSAAIFANCEILYTEGMNDGQIIDGVTIYNPFK